jgi:diacylglycerol O-acyltransferase / wax synthase
MNVEKQRVQLMSPEALAEWVEFTPPGLAAIAVRAHSPMRVADHHRPAFNVTISNVPGPQFPRYSAGARLTAWYPMGPIFDRAGSRNYVDPCDP